MVEILSASLLGANHAFEASSFFTAAGPPPGVGQFLLAIDPGPLSGGSFAERIEVLVAALEDQPDARLRSEEHTSELQSLMRISYAVFCWKRHKTDHTTYHK